MSPNIIFSRRDAICAIPVAIEKIAFRLNCRTDEKPIACLSNTLVFGPLSIDEWIIKAIEKEPLEGLMTKKGDELPNEFKQFLKSIYLYIIDRVDHSNMPAKFVSENYPIVVTQLLDQRNPNKFEVGKKRVRVNISHTTFTGLETQKKIKNDIYVRSIDRIIVSLDVSIDDDGVRTEYVYNFPSVPSLISYTTVG